MTVKKTYIKPSLVGTCQKIAASRTCGLNTVCGKQVPAYF